VLKYASFQTENRPGPLSVEVSRVRRTLALIFGLVLTLSATLMAADFEVEPEQADKETAPARSGAENPVQKLSQPREAAAAPTWLDAGSVPTAYLPMKYELKGDVRFYEGGSIYPKVSLGLFPWLMIGGGIDMRNVIGYGPVTVGDDSAKAAFKLRVLEENSSQPAVAVGWDGPAYSYERLRGLYLSVSKELKTGLGFWQLHAGVNTWSNWKNIDLKEQGSAYAAVTTLFSNLYLFAEYDDAVRQDGGYLNAGFRFTFEPISLGIEFRDLGARHGGSGRLLRVGYTGLF
jgi:hypothetical protein